MGNAPFSFAPITPPKPLWPQSPCGHPFGKLRVDSQACLPSSTNSVFRFHHSQGLDWFCLASWTSYSDGFPPASLAIPVLALLLPPPYPDLPITRAPPLTGLMSSSLLVHSLLGGLQPVWWPQTSHTCWLSLSPAWTQTPKSSPTPPTRHWHPNAQEAFWTQHWSLKLTHLSHLLYPHPSTMSHVMPTPSFVVTQAKNLNPALPPPTLCPTPLRSFICFSLPNTSSAGPPLTTSTVLCP